MTKRTILLDGDIFLYKACFASEETIDLGDEFHLSVNKDKCRANFNSLIAEVVGRCPEGSELVVALSDRDNFRKDLWPAYKENRSSARKPLALPWLRTVCAETYPTVIKPGLEADDVIGILATGDYIEGRKLVVSIDKDLLQIPGAHFNPDKPEEGVRHVSEDEGDRMHMIQTLTGDRVDNYPGCPGTGPVKAEKILADAIRPADMWADVVMAYEKAGLTEADALTQARVAKILDAPLWDDENQTPILWRPL